MSIAWIAQLDALMPIEGRTVRLERLSREHHDALCEVGLDEDLWRWTVAIVHTRADMAAYVDEALALRDRGSAYPFAIVERGSGRVAGSTRFGNMDAGNRRLEIGWTWVGRSWQGTRVNTETKYLLLRTAFERLGCVRVEFKTDVLNERSRAALARLGAKPEGVLRSHMITAAGRLRDTIYYSILDSEWPHVRQRLEQRLAER